MAISSVELKNIRVFSRKRWTFDTAPVTVLCGANSCGKSTVLKSLMLLSQSLNRPEGRDLVAAQGVISLGGPLVDMGTYPSLVSAGRTARDASVSITASYTEDAELVDTLRPASAVPPAGAPIGDSSDAQVSCKATFTFGLVPVEDSPTSQGACRIKTIDFVLKAPGKESLDWSVNLNSEMTYQPKSKYLRSEYQVSMPRWYFERSGGAKFIVVGGRGDSTRVRFGASLDGILPSVMIGALRIEWIKSQKPDDQLLYADELSNPVQALPFPPLIRSAVAAIRESIEGLRYVGPLRPRVERIYVVASDAGAALEEKDEEYVLNALRFGDRYRAINRRLGQDAAEEPLLDALRYWMGYLRTGDRTGNFESEVELRHISEAVVQPRAASPYGGREYAIADSGFGYSQVLPVLVSALSAHRGETVLIEQPEVHLHPAYQVRLAEFIASMASCGKRFILETHSEHVVDALRVAVGEASTQSSHDVHAQDQCRVYFMETEGLQPRITDMSIQPDGTASDWPRSFFGESRELAKRLMQVRLHLSRAERS